MAGIFGVGDILDGKRGDDEDFFKVLGCSETSSDEQITAEYRNRALKCHPDKHPGDTNALEQFQKLKEARDILLDPENRLLYDRWRQSEMCIPYKQWLTMRNRVATTMHWAKPREQTMIDCPTQQKRAELEESLEAGGSHTSHKSSSSSSSPPLAEVRWATSNDHQRYVWKPEKTTSIYSKFRNYKI